MLDDLCDTAERCRRTNMGREEEREERAADREQRWDEAIPERMPIGGACAGRCNDHPVRHLRWYILARQHDRTAKPQRTDGLRERFIPQIIFPVNRVHEVAGKDRMHGPSVATEGLLVRSVWGPRISEKAALVLEPGRPTRGYQPHRMADRPVQGRVGHP